MKAFMFVSNLFACNSLFADENGPKKFYNFYQNFVSNN